MYPVINNDITVPDKWLEFLMTLRCSPESNKQRLLFIFIENEDFVLCEVYVFLSFPSERLDGKKAVSSLQNYGKFIPKSVCK